MKLKDCLELGKECGLNTIEECVSNVVMHSTSMFVHAQLNKELKELQQDLDALALKIPVDTALELLDD
ncbi:MAG: hypothetical protein GY707_05430 [Desulfobacteraceae bacterium]|nr:hypothetical protein [Desulfobacteraceae bacterium]